MLPPLLACIVSALAGAAPAAPGGPAPLYSSSTETERELLLLFEEHDLVTATRRSVSQRRAPAISTVVSRAEIREMGARTLVDVLRLVPGFGISIAENATNLIEVRGIRTLLNEKILLMVDGHALNRSGYGSALYNYADTMLVEKIERVEVVRGPGSALYGSGAFVATINVITRDPAEIGLAEAHAAGGRFETVQGNLLAAGTGEKPSGMVSVGAFQTAGPQLGIREDALRGTAWTRAPGAAQLGYRQIDLFAKAAYGDLSFRGQYLRKHRGANVGLGYALTDEDYVDASYHWGELAYLRRLRDGLSAEVKVHLDHYWQQPLVKQRPPGFGGGFPEGMKGVPIAKDLTIGGELQLDWDPAPGNHVIAGTAFDLLDQYEVKRIANFDPLTGRELGPMQEVFNWNKETTRRTFAAYLQDEWSALPQVQVTAGVRLDHYSDFGESVNPRAGVVYTFLEGAGALKLLFGRALRAPNFVELYNLNNPAVVGNPNLEPETIQTLEASATWQAARWLSVGLDAFRSDIDDLIQRNTRVPAGTTPIFDNIGSARVQGLEAAVGGAVGSVASWRATYTYQDPRDTVADRRIPYVPSHRATGSVHVAPSRFVSLQTDVVWTGRRPRDAGDPRPASPAHALANLVVTGRGLAPGLEVQAAFHNVLDARIRDPDTSGAARRIPGDFPRDGFSAIFGATYRF